MSLPNEEDTLKKDPTMESDEVKVVIAEEPDVELEVVDDTPEEDRNRKALPEGEAEPTEEEMEQYSEAVKRRISKMRHGLHDERRAKEAAHRERDEAIAVAQRILKDKQEIEAKLGAGENIMVQQAKDKIAMAMAEAKRAYKNAYEIGDADGMADAQERLAQVALDGRQADEWARQLNQREKEKIAGQAEPAVIQNAQPRTVSVQPDESAVRWANKNPWFNRDTVMTNAAYEAHDHVVAQGADPTRDPEDYYKKLDNRLRQVFPTHEWGDAPKRNKPTSVVAPVNRTSKTATRVTLTQSQLAVARRMNLTPLQYAIEVAKLEK